MARKGQAVELLSRLGLVIHVVAATRLAPEAFQNAGMLFTKMPDTNHSRRESIDDPWANPKFPANCCAHLNRSLRFGYSEAPARGVLPAGADRYAGIHCQQATILAASPLSSAESAGVRFDATDLPGSTFRDGRSETAARRSWPNSEGRQSIENLVPGRFVSGRRLSIARSQDQQIGGRRARAESWRRIRGHRVTKVSNSRNSEVQIIIHVRLWTISARP